MARILHFRKCDGDQNLYKPYTYGRGTFGKVELAQLIQSLEIERRDRKLHK